MCIRDSFVSFVDWPCHVRIVTLRTGCTCGKRPARAPQQRGAVFLQARECFSNKAIYSVVSSHQTMSGMATPSHQCGNITVGTPPLCATKRRSSGHAYTSRNKSRKPSKALALTISQRLRCEMQPAEALVYAQHLVGGSTSICSLLLRRPMLLVVSDCCTTKHSDEHQVSRSFQLFSVK